MAGRDHLKFFVDLVDKVSGPARTAVGSLRGLERQFRVVDKASSMKSKLANYFKRPMQGARDAEGKFLQTKFGDGFVNDLRHGAKMATPVYKQIGEGALQVASAIGTASVAAVGLGAVGAKYAIDAASFKRNTLAGFKLMLGSESEAKRVYDMANALSDDSPFGDQAVMGHFRTLMASGLDPEAVKQTLLGMFDVGAIVGGAEGEQAVTTMVQQLSKMRSLGKLTVDDMNEIAMASGGMVNTGKWKEQIAKLKGVSVSAAADMISKGKITAEEATTGLLATIQQSADKGGPLGTAMKTFGSASWEGQLSTLGSRFNDMFSDVEIAPLIAVVKSLNDVLAGTTETGKQIRATVGGAFTEAFGKIGAALTPERILEFVNALVKVVTTGYELSKAFGGAAFDAFMAAIQPMRDVFTEMGVGGADMTSTFRLLGQVIGTIAAAIVYGAAVVVPLIGWMADNWKLFAYTIGAPIAIPLTALFAFIGAMGWAIAELQIIAVDMWNMGANIINGLWEGMKSGFAQMLAWFSGVLDMLPLAAKKALGIASPAKPMIPIGAFLMQGVSKGITGEAANTNATLAGAVAVPAPGALPSASSGSGNGGASGGGVVVNISITVQAAPGMSAGDAQAQGQAIGQAAAAQLADTLEELAMAVGA
jgi:hypothetical protein